MKKINLMTILLILGFIGINVQSGLAQFFPNPTQQQVNDWRKIGPCNDPWVSMAVSDSSSNSKVHTTNGADAECDISQYNNGQWNSYDQLRKAVNKRREDMKSVNLRFDSILYGSTKLVVLLDKDNKILAAGSILSHNGGTLVGNDGASMKDIISKALANLVAAGGGNLVAAGGGNLVAAGGGNFADIIKAAKVVPTGGGSVTAAQIKAKLDTANLISNAPAANFTPGSRQLFGVEAKKIIKLGSNFYLIR